MALDVLSHENCPRALMHKSVEQVVPLLQSEYNLGKYLRYMRCTRICCTQTIISNI